jgi:predicted transcriptional regulator
MRTTPVIKSAVANTKHTPPASDDTLFRDAVEEGLTSLDAGRNLPYEKVRRWLLSWGTDKELPPPECP